ncbi:MAG: hypothetical protein M1834_001553 [Cirrosporium novae-zelandiae]|nr:MAG: hypothetical protein M1834_004070 [Cirrosporium novae-zelandiae]KAI9735538.1 MAG: hypothetical protein M1834_001553 [Cirrosporium novae-zelandiae]
MDSIGKADGQLPSERTPLLATPNSDRRLASAYSQQLSSAHEQLDSDIEDGQLDLDLARIVSGSSGIGIEPQVEEFIYPTIDVPRKRNSDSTLCDAAKHYEEESQSDGDTLHYESRYIGIGVFKFWTIFICVLLGYFIACFDSTLMASSHPVITSYFHASNSASWLSTAFLLTSTAFQPLFGRVSDTVGRRPIYLFVLIIFSLTTSWCALAQSIGSFIAARAISGLGAGGTMSLGMIIISDLVPIEDRGIYQSYLNLAFGTGSVSGAAFGGFLCDQLGWRWAFGIQVPYILILFIIAFIATPSDLGPNLAKSSEKTTWEIIKGFDIAGSFAITTTVALLILGVNLGGNVLSWSHPVVICSLILSIITMGFVVKIESHAARPVMPLSLLMSKPRGNLMFGNFFGAIAGNAVMFNVPLFFQAVTLDSPTNSGLRLAIPSIFVTIAAVSTGFIITWSRRLMPMVRVGAGCFLVGSICMSCIWKDIPEWASMLFITISSSGQGFGFPASTMCLLAASAQEEQAVVSTTLALWRNLGTVMGVALSSLILQNTLIAYLNQKVTGEDKAEIISTVRKSVQSILKLDKIHQVQG